MGRLRHYICRDRIPCALDASSNDHVRWPGMHRDAPGHVVTVVPFAISIIAASLATNFEQPQRHDIQSLRIALGFLDEIN